MIPLRLLSSCPAKEWTIQWHSFNPGRKPSLQGARGLSQDILQRLLLSARDFARCIYVGDDITNTGHKERIGTSFSIMLDNLENDCEVCAGRVPGLATMSSSEEHAGALEVWKRVRSCIVLDPR